MVGFLRFFGKIILKGIDGRKKVEEHLAAIRPAVKDRRPFLGQHPKYPNLIIFNGLGTKGASLGPFWAKHLVDFLVYDRGLDSAVNINRFM